MHTADAITRSRVALLQIHRLAMLMLLSFVGTSPSLSQTPWSLLYTAQNWSAISDPVPSADGGVWIAYAAGATGTFTLEKRDATFNPHESRVDSRGLLFIGTLLMSDSSRIPRGRQSTAERSVG